MRRWAPVFAIAALVLFVYVINAREVCRPGPDGVTLDCREYAGIEDVPGAIFAAFADWLGDLIQGLVDMAQEFVLSVLPDAPDLNLPDLSGLVAGFTMFDQWFPLSEGIQGGTLVLAATMASFVFRLALTVWHIIPKPLAGT